MHPAFAQRKKGSSNARYTTLNYGKFTVDLRQFGPKTAKKCPGIVTPKVVELRCERNGLDGTLPDSFMALSLLSFVDLGGNHFSGSRGV